MKSLILLALAGIAATLCLHGPVSSEMDDPQNVAGQMARQAEHGMALFERGHLMAAKATFAALRMASTQILGPRDPATLKSRNNIAAVLYAMGDFTGAEAAHRAVLALREDVLGRLHPDALASRHNLAVTLLSEGKLEEALQNARRVASGRRHILGTDHPHYREAVRLKEVIEDYMEGSRRGNEAPRGGPTGLGGSATGTA